MAAEVVMPRQGWTMEVGSVVEWFKRDGDEVRAGDILFSVQSDKAIAEVEALDSGILRIPPDSPEPGVEVPIGTLLAYILAPGERAPFESPSSGGAEMMTSGSAHERTRSDRGSAADLSSDAARYRRLYEQMTRIRRTEEALARLHQQGLVHGACHTYVGEEAIATGVCAHLRLDDSIFSTHRGHGHALAKGVPASEVIAELLGRDTGCSRGRGGSMHLFKPEVGLLGTSGIVGPSILLATGAAYAFKLNKTERVAVAFFGDGASNNGAFHEGVNMATVWRLPVIFVCENNQYATEIAYSSVSRVVDVSAKAAGYGLPGVSIDGNDVMAVYEVAGEAIQRARAGEGPTLIECKTYRTRAHSEGMRDTGYRSREEVDAWKGRDPIGLFAETLMAGGLATRADLAAIDAAIDAEVASAAEFARNSAWPDPATAIEHVYAN